MTVRKRRRISYANRAKQQRMKLYIIVSAICILFLCSLAPLADSGVHEITVIADSGDTMWDICEPYCPEGMDIRLFIDKVMYENDLDNSCLSIGQEIVIPLD
ncbi:MAG: hypothetical protein IKD21_04835 [Clostridia bacterium]|nr:hypothetical protein [Clostridia bacterium]